MLVYYLAIAGWRRDGHCRRLLLRLRLAALSAAVDEANHSAALRCRFAQKGSTSLMRIASGGKATQLVCE